MHNVLINNLEVNGRFILFYFAACLCADTRGNDLSYSRCSHKYIIIAATGLLLIRGGGGLLKTLQQG